MAIFAVVAVIIVGVAAGFVWNGLHGSSGEYDDWNDHFTAESLVHNSSSIVIAEFTGVENTHEVPSISPVDGEAYGYNTQVYREFRLTETLKGDAPETETFFVMTTAGIERDYRDGGGLSLNYGVAPVKSGATYVLFLDRTAQTEQHPEQYGEWIWFSAGEPAMAELDGERLLFRTRERYERALSDMGMERPIANSSAPFALTVPELKDLVEWLRENPPTPVPTIGQ
ncbi:MAG: hypothetical protein WD208_08475 [Dehalococcoidia bacterium]